MSLEAFAREVRSISGVSSASLLNDGELLQVKWFGEPADYSSTIRELRNEYPTVQQVEAPDDLPKTTSDAMPIAYYQTKD